MSGERGKDGLSESETPDAAVDVDEDNDDVKENEDNAEEDEEEDDDEKDEAEKTSKELLPSRLAVSVGGED